MRKRLLLQLLLLASVVGVYAENVGDFLYTASAKYRVEGANIFVNGNFAQGLDATWTNETGGVVSGDRWGIETNLGPNGENVIQSKGASSEAETWLHFVQPLTAGTYSFSYWVKAPAAVLTSIVATPAAGETAANAGNNAVRFFLNKTGDNDETDATVISGQASFSTEWNRVIVTFTANEGDFLVFNACNMASETMFTNFEIYPVVEVYDTRIADRAIAYAEKLLNEPGFEKETEEVVGTIAAIKETMASGDPDAATMSELITGLDAALEGFLAANAGNTVSTTVEGVSTTRYLRDWSKITSTFINWNNMTAQGTWSFEGGRWGFASNVPAEKTDEEGNLLYYLERPQEDGYVASAGIQTGYDLDVSVKITDSAFSSTSVKAGKYMFSIEAQAVAASGKAQPYGSNEGIEIAGPWMWIGTDTLAFRPQVAADAAEHPEWRFADEKTVLNNHSWQRLYIIGEINEGETVTAGFHFPFVAGTGGRYSLRNPEFRIIGKTQEEVDHLYAYDQLFVQQQALKERLDLANEDYAKTQADGFPWGHAILKDSIDKYTAVYNELLTIVSAEGTELQADKVTLEYKDDILKAVQAMNSARNAFANTNKVYQKLVADIAFCTETMNNELYAAGDKATFKAAIDKAQAMVDATQVDVDQTEEFNNMDVEILTARQDFMMYSASRSNPVDLTFTLKNGGFEDFPSDNKTNYSSSQTVHGWNLTCGTDIKQWQIRVDSTNYTSCKNLNAWRGTTVGPNGKAQQVLKLKKAGVYEYRVKAYATDDTWAQYVAAANILQNFDLTTLMSQTVNDTIFNYKHIHKVFFGLNGSTNDSLVLYKSHPVVLEYTRYTPQTYSIVYVKNNDNEEEFELGFEVYGNGASIGSNGFGFGDNHLYYLGSEAAYKEATQAAFTEESAKAKTLIAKYKDEPLKAGDESLKLGLINGMYRYMGDKENHPLEDKSIITVPTTLTELQNAIISIQENEALLEELATYTPPVDTKIENFTTEKREMPSGIYTLTGIRIQGDINSLPRGLYIINGKKVVIK